MPRNKPNDYILDPFKDQKPIDDFFASKLTCVMGSKETFWAFSFRSCVMNRIRAGPPERRITGGPCRTLGAHWGLLSECDWGSAGEVARRAASETNLLFDYAGIRTTALSAPVHAGWHWSILLTLAGYGGGSIQSVARSTSPPVCRLAPQAPIT